MHPSRSFSIKVLQRHVSEHVRKWTAANLPIWQSASSAAFRLRGDAPARSLASSVHNFSYFVQMWIDLISQVVKLAPGLAKVR